MNLYARLLHLLTFGRRRPSATIWDTVRTPFRVWPTDLDANGHMNNGRYLTLLDLARIDLMARSRTIKASMDAGWYPVVAAQEIKYRRSLKPFQKFEVATTMLGHDTKNVLIKQEFVVGEQVYATAVVKARWLHRSGGSVSMEQLAEVTGEFPAHFTLMADASVDTLVAAHV